MGQVAHQLQRIGLRTLRLAGMAPSPTALFDHLYATLDPAWDTGGPQPELVNLAAGGGINGDVLDIGCGSGENMLYLSGQGFTACGIDVSSVAIEIARRKARERGLDAAFHVGDALRLSALGKTFDTVIDCGLFHLFGKRERKRLAASAAAVLNPGGQYVMLTFSEDNGPGPWTRGVSVQEMMQTFVGTWRLEFIRAARFQTRFEELESRGGAKAWLASFRLRPAD
jgi:SAM-dependent methyltransferase